MSSNAASSNAASSDAASSDATAMRTLVLLRHGQSQWNLENRFTGWYDAGLSSQGVIEAQQAGEALKAAGLKPTVVHTSLLTRAIATANEALAVMGRLWLPVRRDWRLNERHYGALTGLNKAETAEKHSEEQVHIWRRSFTVAPPPMEDDHPFADSIFDDRYRTAPNKNASKNAGENARQNVGERAGENAGSISDVAAAAAVRTECLADVVTRILPWWNGPATADLAAGAVVLVTAHGNSLRALVKMLDEISDAEIANLNIPTGVPMLYELGTDLMPINKSAPSERYLPTG